MKKKVIIFVLISAIFVNFAHELFPHVHIRVMNVEICKLNDFFSGIFESEHHDSNLPNHENSESDVNHLEHFRQIYDLVKYKPLSDKNSSYEKTFVIFDAQEIFKNPPNFKERIVKQSITRLESIITTPLKLRAPPSFS
ncbi:MAG: hypothetical protein A2X64_09600 [Ignavibacteria bacterium GWF2_33_9]|nr:MAG: hypothetical protein A2X64_09600 [Ignavibacteria bacterium GWF2_33_9]